MTPELNPCFYYVSVQGFDRLLILSTIIFGKFYHAATRVTILIFLININNNFMPNSYYFVLIF